MMGISFNNWPQIIFYFAVLFALVKPLGLYMAKVYQGEKTFMSPVLGRLEKGIYKVCFLDPNEEMGWKAYAVHVMVFTTVTMLALYAILRLQTHLPLNPAAMAEVAPDLAFDTAVSFITNTNWQSYGGEIDDELLFADGRPCACRTSSPPPSAWASWRPLSAVSSVKTAKTIGNFWADMTRSLIYILLPLSVILALILVHRRACRSDLQVLIPEAQLMESIHIDEAERRFRQSHDPGAGHQDAIACRGAGRLANRDQAARHQRRRIL